MLKFRKNKQKNKAYASSTSGEEEEPEVTLDDNELGYGLIKNSGYSAHFPNLVAKSLMANLVAVKCRFRHNIGNYTHSL